MKKKLLKKQHIHTIRRFENSNWKKLNQLTPLYTIRRGEGGPSPLYITVYVAQQHMLQCFVYFPSTRLALVPALVIEQGKSFFVQGQHYTVAGKKNLDQSKVPPFQGIKHICSVGTIYTSIYQACSGTCLGHRARQVIFRPRPT